MKRIILTTALLLGAAAPALAQSQLERSLGVEPGRFTSAELAQLQGKAHEDSYIERKVFVDGGPRFSASNRGGRPTQQSVHSPRAQRIFDRIREESREDE